MIHVLLLFSLPILTHGFTIASQDKLEFSSSTYLSATAGAPLDCLIIGSGVTGSCLSFHLSKTRDVMMFDKNGKVGGNVMSREKDGFVWEVSLLYFTLLSLPRLLFFFPQLFRKTKQNNFYLR